MPDHTDCCPALALFVLGDVERARIAAEVCEWGRLQRLFDEKETEMMDYQEGYADGLAGAGMQDREEPGELLTPFVTGFLLGSLDRKAMLTKEGK